MIIIINWDCSLISVLCLYMYCQAQIDSVHVLGQNLLNSEDSNGKTCSVDYKCIGSCAYKKKVFNLILKVGVCKPVSTTKNKKKVMLSFLEIATKKVRNQIIYLTILFFLTTEKY